MIHQLFIDGQLADIGENAEVTLIHESNLLTGGADLVSNHSLTITLPATMKNRSLFGLADIVQNNSTAPYLNHAVEYHRNGVPIITGGIGRLMKFTVTDIEFVIVYGMKAAIEKLVSIDETLADIDTNVSIEFHAVPQVDSFADATTNDVFYAELDCAQKPGDNDYYRVHVTLSNRSYDVDSLYPASSYLHPSVRMNWLLAQVAARYNVQIDFDDSNLDLSEVIVPLISRIPNDITFNGGYKAALTQSAQWGNNQYSWFDIRTSNNSPIIVETTTDPAAGHITCAQAFKGVMRFSLYLYIPKSQLTLVAYPVYKTKYGYMLTVMVNGVTQNVTVIPADTVIMAQDINAGDEVGVYFTGTLPIEMQVNDTLTFGVTCITGGGVYSSPPGIYVYGGTMWINEIIGSINEVQPTQQYPVAGNLPEIKPVDLIKFLCALTGMIPVQASTADKLQMRNIESIFDWTRAVDWSDRLLSPTERTIAEETTYTPDNWAQRNMWRWKDDDTVVGDYDGGITVNDETVDEERTVMTFPFAATDGNNIPMYTTERKWDDDTQSWHTETKWHKVEPRVLKLVKGENDEAVGSFEFDMTNILSAYYMDLSATMEEPVVIKETVKLNDLEFMSLDETKAIFLAQHGAYFALLSCELHQDGTAKVKLLRLKKQEEI